MSVVRRWRERNTQDRTEAGTDADVSPPIAAEEPRDTTERAVRRAPDLNAGQPVLLRPRGEDLPVPTGPACRAPFASLHLDQFGNARACCQSELILGNVAEQSLLDIWEGEPLARQRRAIEANDYSVGCGYCEWSVRNDGPELAYARNFDRLALPTPGGGPTTLEMALSNSCNLQCTMCNGDYSSSIRLHREKRPPLPAVYDEGFFTDFTRLLPGLEEIHLLGGEPFLGAEPLRIMGIVADSDAAVRLIITTNGTLWTDRIERLTERLSAHYVISIDGASAETYESIRLGARWDELQVNLERFKAAGEGLHFAYCLMVENCHELPDLLALAKRFDAPVFINTVLTPLDSSLHHLSPLDLRNIIAALEARDDEVMALGEPWATTWRKELSRLRDTLDDSTSGEVHGHLTGDQRPPRPDEAEAIDADDWAADDPARRVFVIDLDDERRATAVDVRSGGVGLPEIDLEVILGQPFRHLTHTLELAGEAPIEASRVVHHSTEALFDEERLVQVGEDLFTDRRILRQSADGRWQAIVVQRRFETTDESALTEDLAAGCPPDQPVVVIDLDRHNTIVGVGPSLEVAATIGLTPVLGDACHSPMDVLDPALRHPDATVDFRPIDWVTNHVRLTTPTGLELRATSRLYFERGQVQGARSFVTVSGVAERTPSPTT